MQSQHQSTGPNKEDKKADLQTTLNYFVYRFIQNQAMHSLDPEITTLPGIPDVKSWSYQTILEQIDLFDKAASQRVAGAHERRELEIKALKDKKEQLLQLKKQSDEIAKIIKLDENLEKAKKDLKKIENDPKQQSAKLKLEAEIEKLTKKRATDAVRSVTYQQDLDERILNNAKELKELEEKSGLLTIDDARKLARLQDDKKGLDEEKKASPDNLDPVILNDKQQFINMNVLAITKYTQEHLQLTNEINDLKRSLTKIPDQETMQKKQEMLELMKNRFKQLLKDQPTKQANIEKLLNGLNLETLSPANIQTAHERIDAIVASENEIKFTTENFADKRQELDNLIRDVEHNLAQPDDSADFSSRNILYPFAKLYELFFKPLPESPEVISPLETKEEKEAREKKAKEKRQALDKEILNNMKLAIQDMKVADGFKDKDNQKLFDGVFLKLIDNKIKNGHSYNVKEQFEKFYNQFFKNLGVSYEVFLQAFVQSAVRNSSKIKPHVIDIVAEVCAGHALNVTEFPENSKDPIYFYLRFQANYDTLLSKKELTKENIENLVTQYKSFPPSATKKSLLNQISILIMEKQFSLLNVGRGKNHFLREEFEKLIAQDSTAEKEYRANLKEFKMSEAAERENALFTQFASRLTILETQNEQAVAQNLDDPDKRDRELDKIRAFQDMRTILASREYGRFFDINDTNYSTAFGKKSGKFQDFVTDLQKAFSKEIAAGLQKDSKEFEAEQSSKQIFSSSSIDDLAEQYVALCATKKNPDTDLDSITERKLIVEEILRNQFATIDDEKSSFVREAFFKKINEIISPPIAQGLYTAKYLFERDCTDVLKENKDSDLPNRSKFYLEYVPEIMSLEKGYQGKIDAGSTGDDKKRQQQKMEVLQRLREILSEGKFMDLKGINGSTYKLAFQKKGRGFFGENELEKFINKLKKELRIPIKMIQDDIDINAKELRRFSQFKQKTVDKSFAPGKPLVPTKKK